MGFDAHVKTRGLINKREIGNLVNIRKGDFMMMSIGNYLCGEFVEGQTCPSCAGTSIREDVTSQDNGVCVDCEESVGYSWAYYERREFA